MDELDPTAGPSMTYQIDEDPDGGGAVVTIAGELDMTNVGEVEAAVAPVVGRRPQRLVIDLSGLRFADSSAIALWVRWANQVEQLELREPSLLLRRVISRMGLAQRLRVTP
jgi:anti-sigma B factor antagonist